MMLLALMTAFTLQNTYPRAMEITRVDLMADKAICVDATGMEWEFYEPEDLTEGDIIICTMYDNGTKDKLIDDEIVDVRWSGYWIESEKIMSFTRRETK